jgi:hypothetical protein
MKNYYDDDDDEDVYHDDKKYDDDDGFDYLSPTERAKQKRFEAKYIKSVVEKQKQDPYKISNLLVLKNDLGAWLGDSSRIKYEDIKKTIKLLGPGWRLPTQTEMTFLHTTFYKLGIGKFNPEIYWIQPLKTNDRLIMDLRLNVVYNYNNGDYGLIRPVKNIE